MRIFFMLSVLACLFLNTDVRANGNVDIEIEYLNYENDTLLLAYYIGDKILIKDTLFAERKYHFQYSSEELLESGMYMLVSLPDKKFFQFLINQEDQKFSITTDFFSKEKTVASGSVENGAFFDYLVYLDDQRTKIASIDEAIEKNELTEALGQTEKKKLAGEVEAYQFSLINKYKQYVFSMIIAANMSMHFPEFEGTDEEKELEKYLYYKEHYFDLIDLGHPATLRTPFLHKRVMYYLDNLTLIQADSIVASVDYLLEKMRPGEKTYQFYLSHFLNTYGNSKYIGLDKVYVHLALNYYDKGLAPWISDENRNEIVGNARKMLPTLLGETAPDFTAYLEDGTKITLSELAAAYTILVFWAPDCGHCTKAMPHLREVQEKYAEDGVRILTVCNKAGEKFATCWDGVKEKNMETFLNTADQYKVPLTLKKYNVLNTPLILVLDYNKEILLKRVPAGNLVAIMGQVIKKGKGDQKG